MWFKARQARRAAQRALDVHMKHSRKRREEAAKIVALLVSSHAGAVRREVQRSTGGWMGSTLYGYMTAGDDVTYRLNFRMTEDTVDHIVDLVRGTGLMSKKVTKHRFSRAHLKHNYPSLKFKVCACLYLFGHGGTVKVAADVAGIGTSTLRQYLFNFCAAIFNGVKPKYMPCTQPKSSHLHAVRSEFASRRGIPNVAMACDGTHIPFNPARKNAIDFKNYKGWTSILVVAFVDSFYRFVDADVGWSGRAGDNTVLAQNWLLKAISKDRESWLGKDGLIIGDGGASDGDNVFLNPFHAPTEPSKCWYNFCHSSTRFYVEQVFGQWKNRFRFLLNPCNTKQKLTNQMIYAAAILHNVCTYYRRDDMPVCTEGEPDWARFFTKYASQNCPSCTRRGAAHCVHAAENRNRVKEQRHVRGLPSMQRAAVCNDLWKLVTKDGARLTSDDLLTVQNHGVAAQHVTEMQRRANIRAAEYHNECNA